jgi:serine/threonine protein kinase
MHAIPITHPNRDQLAAYSLGKLDDTETIAVVEHLETCDACRQTVLETPSDTFINAVQAAQPAREAALPPELVNHPRFRAVRELGRGGMGVVYLAEHRLMERPVAIKVVRKSLLDNPEAVERFYREVRAAAKLDHKNIVRAYDAEQAGDLHMLVMEYVEGVSLAQDVEHRGPLPLAHACHYVLQAALALQHAFEKGMVHRDLKPHNLMLIPETGVVKVLDFGLARLASERQQGKGLTAENAVMGTPEYIAPEQAMDARQADIRADIYSLGCTLYCLLAGRPPFVEQTAMLTILAHRDKKAVRLHEVRSDVPAKLSAVAARMIAKDPARRYPTPRGVADALAPFANPRQKLTDAETASTRRELAATSASLTEQMKDGHRAAPRRRPRWALALAITVGMLALGLVAGILCSARTCSIYRTCKNST